MVSDLIRSCLPSDSDRKVITSYNGYNPDIFNTRQSISASAGSPIRILFVGNLIELKGIRTLIHAYCQNYPLFSVPTELWILGPVSYTHLEVKTSQRERKPKADYDEMFANLPIHYEEVNTLSEEDRQCPACGSGMRRYGQNSVIPGQSWSVSCTLPPPMDVRPVKTRRTRSSSKTKGARHLSRADMLLHPRCHISCKMCIRDSP